MYINLYLYSYKITISPPEQHSISKIITKEFGVDIRLLNEYEKAIKILDFLLGTSNSENRDQLFTRGRHNILDLYYLPQSFLILQNSV